MSLYILFNLCVWWGGLEIRHFSLPLSLSLSLCVCSCVKNFFLVPSFETWDNSSFTLELSHLKLVLNWCS